MPGASSANPGQVCQLDSRATMRGLPILVRYSDLDAAVSIGTKDQ